MRRKRRIKFYGMAIENKKLYLINKGSNKIYTLLYPKSVISFCEFDFSLFLENAESLLKAFLKTGKLEPEQLQRLKMSIAPAHAYIENSLDFAYDKIVTDCWISILCESEQTDENGLWKRFSPCATIQEKLFFQRLCDFRFGRAKNLWTELIAFQQYAITKLEFVFRVPDRAKTFKGYFDLAMGIAARELGADIESLSGALKCSAPKLANAPFIMPKLAKGIVLNNLAELDYAAFEKNKPTAMDAFLQLKDGIKAGISDLNAVEHTFKKFPDEIYLVTGIKTIIDLELDKIVESDIIIDRCENCGRLFAKDKADTSRYCSRVTSSALTCAEIMAIRQAKENIEAQKPREKTIDEKCAELISFMRKRVGADLSLKEFNEWYLYFGALRENVEREEATSNELEQFISYSYTMDISLSKPAETVEKPLDEKRSKEPKPFVPERVDKNAAIAHLQNKQDYIPFSFEEKAKITPIIRAVGQEKANPKRSEEVLPDGNIVLNDVRAFAPVTEKPAEKPLPQVEKKPVQVLEMPVSTEKPSLHIELPKAKPPASVLSAYGKAQATEIQPQEEQPPAPKPKKKASARTKRLMNALMQENGHNPALDINKKKL